MCSSYLPNIEISLTSNLYFILNDNDDLMNKIILNLNDKNNKSYDMSKYDWSLITEKTNSVYDELMNDSF